MALVRPRGVVLWLAVFCALFPLYLWSSRVSRLPSVASSPLFKPAHVGAASPNVPSGSGPHAGGSRDPVAGWRMKGDETYLWRTVTTHYPPTKIRPLPTAEPTAYPRVQAVFDEESAEDKTRREERRAAVKEVFVKCWTAYKEHAWLADELTPVTGETKSTLGGWGATLVEALDTLWIMDMKDEFDEAVAAVEGIDFTRTETRVINAFETNIRYLGGFLSSFDLSGDVRLLRKAAEVGEMLYKAFDTPNRMPLTRWDVHAAKDGRPQVASTGVLAAEIGGLSLEFTRLSQLTGDPKWFDAVQRVMDALAAQQQETSLPGLWPVVANAEQVSFSNGAAYTLGAMADSLYEYIPKMAALLGGALPIYQSMYEKAIDVAIEHSFFRPMTPTNADILIAGSVNVRDESKRLTPVLEPQGQHLVCFAGGLVALGSRLFGRKRDMEVARKLTDGCVWTYRAFPRGVMPETFHMLPCQTKEGCPWEESRWKAYAHALANNRAASAEETVARDRLPLGFTAVPDRRYVLRGEAIESVFVLYRTTGRRALLDAAWDMFAAANGTSGSALANSAVWDVTLAAGEETQLLDSMDSSWTGETLKYFYLALSEPGLLSLDAWVFNTRGHPLRRTLGVAA